MTAISDGGERTVPARAASGPQLLRPLRVRDFRLLFSGESISVLGDQFHFVALAWLTLQLTGSGLALGDRPDGGCHPARRLHAPRRGAIGSMVAAQLDALLERDPGRPCRHHRCLGPDPT